MPSWLRDRSTGELLIILITATVCGIVLSVAASLIVESWVRPEKDTSAAATFIGDILNTLIGLMAGFLAGRTDLERGKKNPPEEK